MIFASVGTAWAMPVPSAVAPVGLGALTLGLLLLAVVLAGPVRWRFDDWRRDRARDIEEEARRHAIAAERQREAAIEREERAVTPEQILAATERREEAERELEQVAHEGARARRIDPDLETDPDLDRPRLVE